jgi:hypothetical protein
VTDHRDIRYDREKKTRHGSCQVTRAGGVVVVGYRVYWQDQETGQFRVELER